MSVTSIAKPIWQQEVDRAREQFEASVTEHEMTVLLDTLDEGKPYRHVRFSKPGTSIWSFSLVTWPGRLAISGDLQDHTFSRLHDMFAFFRGSRQVNVSYWAEKLKAEGQNTSLGENRFSSERYREEVERFIQDQRDDLTKADFREFEAHARQELLSHGPDFIEEAHDVLNGFRWYPSSDRSSGREIRCHDVWEWDLRGYDHHFLLALHAIQYGVNTYLAAFPDRFIPEGAN